jgi:hypothetical protein
MKGCDGLDSMFFARSHRAQCARRAAYERGDGLGRRARMTCSGTMAHDELRSSEKAEQSARGSWYVKPGEYISTMESTIRVGNALLIKCRS